MSIYCQKQVYISLYVYWSLSIHISASIEFQFKVYCFGKYVLLQECISISQKQVHMLIMC